MGDGDIPSVEASLTEGFFKVFDDLSNTIRTQETFPAALQQDQDALKVISLNATLRSMKASHFNSAIVQNAQDTESITGLSSNKIKIKRVRVESAQNLDWDIYFYNTNAFINADLDLDTFAGRVRLDAVGGAQIAGANQYYYDSGELAILYEDLGGIFTANIGLINRSAVAKLGANNFVIILEYEPQA